MTDTKCPHCGADFVCQWSTKTLFTCQTVIDDDPLCSFQSHQCLETERDNLKAKVAAQQELLKEAGDAIAKTVQIIYQYDEWHREDFQPLVDMSRKLTSSY